MVISLHLRLFRPIRTREKGGRGGRGRGRGGGEMEGEADRVGRRNAISLPATSVGASRSIQQWESISRLGLVK